MNENDRKRAAIRAVWADYHARVGQWIPTLKVGDRVGLTDRLVHCDRTRAALGTVRSITPTGRINVDVDGWEHPVTYTREGTAYSKWRTFGFLELPEMLTKLIEDIAEYDRLLAERAALRKAWFEQLGWDTKTANLFRSFATSVDYAHEVTDELRTTGAEILRVLVAMGITPTPADVRERILQEEITRLRVALHQTVTAARFPNAPDAWDQVRDAGAALDEDRRVLLISSEPLHTAAATPPRNVFLDPKPGDKVRTESGMVYEVVSVDAFGVDTRAVHEDEGECDPLTWSISNWYGMRGPYYTILHTAE